MTPASRFHWGREGEADGGYGREKKKGNLSTKNAVGLECIKKI